MTYSARHMLSPTVLLAFILTAGVWVLDSLTPLGYAVPMLYLAPLVLIGYTAWNQGVYWFAAGATLMTIAGYFTGPDGGESAPALFNRGASFVVFWGAAFVISSEKRTEWAMAKQVELTRAILDAVTAQVTLIDRRGQAHEFFPGGVSSSGHQNGFFEALQSSRWHDLFHGMPLSPVPDDPDDYLIGVREVAHGRRPMYSTEYGQQTASGFRWYLLYARVLKNGEGAVVAHIDMTERRQAQAALREREREIQLLIDAREALARDLHDEVIQRLYAMGLKLTAWRRRYGEAGSRAASRFGEAIFDVDQVILQVRGYLDGNPKTQISGEELPSHVRRLVTSMTKDTGVVSECSLDPSAAGRLAPTQIPHVLAIVREATSNALQHAGANKVKVALVSADDYAVLTVTDNGRGFEVETGIAGRGRGLTNLRARAGAMGGQAEVISRRAGGTAIRVQIPLEVGCEVR